MLLRNGLCRLGTIVLLLVSGCAASDVTPPPSGLTIAQATLTTPGSRPFHMKAVITERGDPTSKTEVEIFWAAPDKWRRTIQSQTEFSQTLVVNGDRVFEKDSDDYFPLWSRTLVTAMVDPKVVLDAYRPGDRLITKANGSAQESGTICFDAAAKMCIKSRYGLTESVGAAGHSVDFTDYRDFHGKRVARILTYHVDPGDSYTGQVTELKDLNEFDPSLFFIDQSIANSQPIRSVILPEEEIRKLALQPLEIIWPQVLDGLTTGQTSYYVSLDRSGQVAEVLPLKVTAERADGSARRQIMKWKFRPTLQDNSAVQAEGVLSFDFNTRAYGPPEPLPDPEARKLASTIVEPEFPPRTTAGTTYSFAIAVDEAGSVIEIIAGEGPHDLFAPCFRAIQKWRFNPLVRDGKPLPYRAQVVFRAP